jgi:O-antigen/teichoic acid export membrane protein
MDRFRELFSYGKDIFLVNVGNQVLEASQLIIVTRTMGLHAAAIWSVSTKLFSLVYQLVTKIEGTAVIFFAEMMVREEKDKLMVRFRQTYQLTAGISVVALAVVIALNNPFVSAWAEPSLAWAMPLSVLIAMSVFVSTIVRCSGDLIVHTKRIAFFRYIYFLEAASFVLLALWLSSRIGFYGVACSGLVCLLIFRGVYTTWRMVHYFNLPAQTFWWAWLKRSLAASLILTPFVLSAGYLTSTITHPWLTLLIVGAWVGIPAAATLLFVAVPRDVASEIVLRWQQFVGARKLQ